MKSRYNNLIRNVLILFIAFFIIKCKHERPIGIKEKLLNYTLDSIINKEIANYDICGRFINEYSDSILLLNFLVLDKFLVEDDYKTMIEQYNEYSGKDIKSILHNTEGYLENHNNEYVLSDTNKNIINHICLSVPLLSNDKKTAIILFSGYNLQHMIVEDYIYIFNIENENWKIYVTKSSYSPPITTHKQPYSLVPKAK